ncbi:MAG: hypothetical protein GEU74_10170 [Nitriliruptorales bacterium]|nr:hypothetical protein [Nitriliruptorales bacterium]
MIGAAFAASLTLVTFAGPAAAHARLISTDPAGGATLDEAPESVRLTFSEAIETTFAGVQVFGPDRQRVESGEARVDGERVIVPLIDDLPGGRYTAVFRIISADGHPVRSQFRFTYDAPAPEPTETVAADPTESPGATEAAATETPSVTPTNEPDADVVFELQDAGPGTAVGLWVARLLNYTALTALAGMMVTALYLLPAGFGADHRRWVRRAAWAAGLWAVSALALFTFGLSSVAARPLPEAVNADLVTRFLETRFGLTVLTQTVLAAVCAVLAVMARTRTMAVAVAGLAAVAAAAIPWWGHAGTDELTAVALASALSHIVAVATWVGGLVMLIVLLRHSNADAGTSAQRFSRLAGIAFTVVVLTGVVNAALHMGAVANLWDTTWGRLVVGKLIAIAVIGAFAWRNRNSLLPRIAASGGAGRSAFRRLAAAEIGVMAVAFGLAAGLASGIPADAEAASRIQSVVSQFGDGQINVTVDPAEVGGNLVHLYFLASDGTQREVEEPSLTFTGGGETLDAELLVAGPGHYTVLSQQFPSAGEYEMRVSADVEGQAVSTTATIVVR